MDCATGCAYSIYATAEILAAKNPKNSQSGLYNQRFTQKGGLEFGLQLKPELRTVRASGVRPLEWWGSR